MVTSPHRPAFALRTQLDLHQELHARLPLATAPNAVVSYWLHVGMDQAHAEQALATLCLACGAPPPAPGLRHHLLNTAAFALKYERHGEFISWQVQQVLDSPDVENNAALGALLREASALPLLPDAFVALLSAPGAGSMLAATHVLVLDSRQADDMLARCRRLLGEPAAAGGRSDPGSALIGAWVGDKHRAALLTQLQLGADGFTRFLLLDMGLYPDQAAREVQRLCEIEAYRMLAMQGFPLAQQQAQALAELERRLQHTVDQMADDDARDDNGAFEALSRLAADIEHATARTRYRFSATRAYHRLVQQRLTDLREQRIAGVQTLSGFLSRRFAPAMALCEGIDLRMSDIAERIHRAAAVARVRIEERREEGNQALLRALAKRQKQQLRLQQTVEGLSVVAISYYTLGLVGYLAKAAKGWPAVAAWWPAPDVVVGLAVLPVLALVTWFVNKLQTHAD